MNELTGCPHCGSPTKHKSWCPDQKIINAFKDLREAEKELQACSDKKKDV